MKGLAASLVVGLGGLQPCARERAWLRLHRPGGVILFSRNIKDINQLIELCDSLHELVPGLEICADHEGGAVSHLAAAVGRPPAAWGLGLLDDPELTQAVHRETGARLRAAGIDRILGPVADVLTEPGNPVIGARAFGADPQLVARHVSAAVAGYRQAGLTVCAKHWPGHGHTRQDTHDTGAGNPPEDPAAAALPFTAAITAGADAVMIGHLPVGPAGEVATLAAGFLERTRRLLAPAGGPVLLFADDLTMGALRGPMLGRGIPAPDGSAAGLVEPGDLSVSWLEAPRRAGCDRLLLRGIPWGALPLVSGLPPQGAGATAGPGAKIDLPPAPSWPEARQRLRNRQAAGFADRSESLVWLDLSLGDRWWQAAGSGEGNRRRLEDQLAAGFASVEPMAGSSRRGSCRRLLVTSYRPWRPTPEQTSALARILAPEGAALVLGHPQLARALERILPAGWRLGALFDICAEDLAGAPAAKL